jgi:hypothetical protein
MPITEKTTTFYLDTSKLDEMIAKDTGKFADIVGKTAFRILTDARMVTPRDPARPPKDPEAYKPSGELRANSDVVKVTPDGLTQNVEYYQVYAAAQELGRPEINLPARPYLTPAVEKAAPQFVDDLAKAMET